MLVEAAAGASFLKVFQWVWDNFAKDFVKSNFKRNWDTFKEEARFDKAAAVYAEEMLRRYGTIKILDMTSPVSLEGIYTRVKILDKPTAFTGAPKDHILKTNREHKSFGDSIGEPKESFGVFWEHDKLFILGKPGAGKTTFLKYIILRATQEDFGVIPICIELKRFADDDVSLMDYLVRQFEICGFPEAEPFIKTILKQGKAVVLCDGLDEVNREGGVRDRVIKELIDFSEQYHRSRFVITCRIAATEYSFEKFDYVEMADFNEEQIEIFVGKWFTGDEETRKLFLNEYNKPEQNRLHTLATNPLLLNLLCLAFKENLSFPARRCDIYKDAIEILMRKWDDSRLIKRDEIYRNLTLGKKLNMLARIAAESYEKGEFLLEKDKLAKMVVEYLKKLPQADAPEDIDGEAVLKAVEAQHGIWVERTKDLYTFSHLTFQEYLTAKYIVNNAGKGTLKELIDNHIEYDNWREVFILTAEMLDDAENFFALFLTKLNEIAKRDDKLIWLLLKARIEAEKSELEYIPMIKRCMFICFFLSLTLIINRALDYDPSMPSYITFDLDLNSALDHTHDLAQALDHTHALILVLTLTKDLTQNLAEDLVLYNDFSCDRARVRLLILTLTIEEGLDNIYDSFIRHSWLIDDLELLHSFAVELASHIENAGLRAELKHIQVPGKNTSERCINKYSNRIFSLIEKQVFTKKYEFTKEQAEYIASYLKASKLLVDCLTNACVSDREGIMDRLLLPPKDEGKVS